MGGTHGGGAFSGKDPTKVDRSAAYAARWVAKSLVNARLCHRVLVQLSYAIGVAYPLSIHANSYGTGPALSGKTDVELVEIIKANFDLRPGCIVCDLQLRRPMMQKTAAYGHFGREDDLFTWTRHGPVRSMPYSRWAAWTRCTSPTTPTGTSEKRPKNCVACSSPVASSCQSAASCRRTY